MALDRWFPASRALGGQPVAFTPEQTTPPASRKWKKRQKGDSGATVVGSIPPTQLPTPITGRESAQVVAPRECSFQLGDKTLPSNLYFRTWRSSEGGHVSYSLRQALMVSADMEHYADCSDDDLVLKLKWHTVANYYDRGFRHAGNSVGLVIFQTRKFRFMEGWMAVVNAIGLPSDSPLGVLTKCPFPRTLLLEPRLEKRKRTAMMRRRVLKVQTLESCLDRSNLT
ncbi:hypothetical protein CMV_023811 [Castanea mollissima]|uniref:Uncharacterized protein n=1 Tax=Castanea mollissima TaxID=60419 RepID=A0A8J4QSI5_9ROSI|nr:hypothetical protein CMV_023811 [Castanea mollissima]